MQDSKLSTNKKVSPTYTWAKKILAFPVSWALFDNPLFSKQVTANNIAPEKPNYLTLFLNLQSLLLQLDHVTMEPF